MTQRGPLLCWILLTALSCPSTFGADAMDLEKIVFRADFEGTNALKGWLGANSNATLASGFESKQALQVRAVRDGANVLRAPIPVEGIRGARLRIEAIVKAADVSPPPNPWNGIKCMLHITSPAGSTYPQQNNVYGAFDWKKIQFSTRVPSDANTVELVLGLEQVSGTAWFDDVRVSITSPPRLRPTTPPAGAVYKGHGAPRLRGVMLGRVGESDLRELGRDWGANHARWQLLWGGFPHSPADNGDLAAYDKWLEGELQRLGALLPVCQEVGIKVLIDLHTPPGGRNAASECRLFHEKRFQDSFLGWWDKISRRFNGNTNIWGYDLVNEPVEGTVESGCMSWQQLATAAARIVRTNDPNHAIIVEPEPWGGPESMENLSPIPVRGVVYSAHMYLPHRFTHQGVYDKKMGLRYPGEVDGKLWNKDQLRKALQPVMDFQRDYNTHIYIGEFSAIRWAPDDSAYRYLKDCIEIFEENGWDWAYHAFREWDGWSVEHTTDQQNRSKSSEETNRQRLLKEWFKKNRP